MNTYPLHRTVSTRVLPLFLMAFVWCAGCTSDESMPGTTSNQNERDDDSLSDFEPVRPLRTVKIESPDEDPTVKNPGSPDPVGERIRKLSRSTLERGGFQFAGSLPTLGHRADVPGKLRPIREVALRLMALDALYTWVTAPEDSVSSERLNAYVDRSGLLDHLTESECQIISMPRGKANQQYGNTIGWHLENMWALAWILGFDPPPDPMSGQLPDEVSRAVVLEFLPGLDASVDELLQKSQPRSEDAVIELEDVFYCAHNAVRSAQTGSQNSVPNGFHPVRDGGAIHERRHSLTWAISPDVEWDDTDLST